MTRFEVSNDVNYKLNFYPVKLGSVGETVMWKVMSDVLVDGYNAQLGQSTVTIKRIDMTTNAEVIETFEILIISPYEYEQGLIDGTVVTGSSTLDFLKSI